MDSINPVGTVLSPDITKQKRRCNNTGRIFYKCPNCAYETIHSSTLKTHLKTHSAERPWKCDLCSKSFKLKHHLKHHLATHKQPSSITFKCNLCPYRGASSVSLLLHKQNKHGEMIQQVNMNRVLNNVMREPRVSTSFTASFPTWTTSMPSTSTARSNSFDLLREMSFGVSGPSVIRSRSLSDNESGPLITSISSADEPPHFPRNLNFGMAMSDHDTSPNAEVVTVKSDPGNDDVYINMVDESSDTGTDDPYPSTSGADTAANVSSDDPPLPAAAEPVSLPTSTGAQFVEVTRPDIVPNSSALTSSPASSWKCEPCGITFPDNIMYGLHTACHSVQQPYKCNICGKVCRDKYDFTFHITMGRHDV